MAYQQPTWNISLYPCIQWSKSLQQPTDMDLPRKILKSAQKLTGDKVHVPVRLNKKTLNQYLHIILYICVVWSHEYMFHKLLRQVAVIYWWELKRRTNKRERKEIF